MKPSSEYPAVVRRLAGDVPNFLELLHAMASPAAAAKALGGTHRGYCGARERWQIEGGKVSYRFHEHGEGAVPLLQVTECLAAGGHELQVAAELRDAVVRRSELHAVAHPLARSYRGHRAGPLPAELAAEPGLRDAVRDAERCLQRVREHLAAGIPLTRPGEQLDLFAAV